MRLTAQDLKLSFSPVAEGYGGWMEYLVMGFSERWKPGGIQDGI
jgi:hypothetical protein